MKEFAISEWKRAILSLKSSKYLANKDPNSAASRSYYAAFHAVSALFATRGCAFSKHSAVRAAVHRDLVNSGEWAPELGQDYDFLMDMRETGDYGGIQQVTSRDAKAASEASTRIIDAVRKGVPELGTGLEADFS